MRRIILVLTLMLGISTPNYAQISLNIGAETGTVADFQFHLLKVIQKTEIVQ